MTVVLYNSSLVALRPIYAMRFVVTICTWRTTDTASRERKNAPTSVKKSKKRDCHYMYVLQVVTTNRIL